MAEYLKCHRCGCVFQEHEAYTTETVDHEEFWGSRVSRHEIILGCPDCASEDHEEFHPCELCELSKDDRSDWNEPVDGCDVCVICGVSDTTDLEEITELVQFSLDDAIFSGRRS